MTVTDSSSSTDDETETGKFCINACTYKLNIIVKIDMKNNGTCLKTHITLRLTQGNWVKCIGV